MLASISDVVKRTEALSSRPASIRFCESFAVILLDMTDPRESPAISSSLFPFLAAIRLCTCPAKAWAASGREKMTRREEWWDEEKTKSEMIDVY
jgi:hypothetical protein